jgi:CHAT domain-containing protein/tetratricopeptide (TPR) repeat protein
MSRPGVLLPSRIFSLVLSLLALHGWAHAATTETDTRLEVGKTVERQIAGGEIHSYQLDLPINQYADVVVDQRGIDIAIWGYDSKGQKLVEADSFRAGDEESIVFVGESTGPYRLEIRPTSAKAPQGSYAIRIKELRTATEKEKYAVTASRIVADAIKLERLGSAESFRKAIAKHQESLPIWKLAGSAAWEANVLYLIANDYVFLGEKQKALEAATNAVQLAQATAKTADKSTAKQGDKSDWHAAVKVEANAFDILGRVHNELGDKRKALEYFNQALPLHKSIGDRAGELASTVNISMAYQYMGDFQQALAIAEQASAIAEELGDFAKQGTIFNNMCVLHENLGDLKRALDYCNRALAVRHNYTDAVGEAVTLGNLGGVHASLGDYQSALDFYHRGEAAYKALENRSGQGVALNNIGWVYATLGDYEKALDFYNQGVEIFVAMGDQNRAAHILNNVAATYTKLGDYQKALELGLRVLPMRRAVNNHDGAASTLRQIANAYAHLNKKQEALDYYKQAIELLRENPRQLTAALRDQGSLYIELGEPQNAVASFNEALQISRRIGDSLSEADALAGIAEVERDRGNLMEAKRLTQTALVAVESLRVNIKSQSLRASFFASVRKYHELYIDVLMRLHQQHPSDGFDAAALQASESARARSLLELLMEANAQIRQGVDLALVEREERVRQSISVGAEQQIRLLSAKHTDKEAKDASDKLNALANEYDDIQAKIRQTSPRYAALTQPAPLNLKEIQSQLLDENTVLLEYSLGEDSSYLWAVSRNSLRSFALPKRAEIEEAARRVYDLLTASDRNLPNESLEQRRQRLAQADESYPNASAALSRMLLGPVAAELKNKRLLIIAEGVLQYVPFAALTEPDQSGTPLMVKHEIVSLPSASVLGVLRRETKERAAAAKSIAVFADPVFSENDPRLMGKEVAAHAGPDEARDVKRSAEESGLANFARLRFSREEANQILKFAARNNSLEALDFSASRSNATSSDLQNYHIVHFATHGIINSRHPELSGMVLSLVDQNGKPQNGFLRLYDIYNLNLNADLVVLSACQTALGRDVKGEGLIGLTRAFMYGGATRVVASLWQTDDRGTSVLMSRFYENLLSRRMSPAAALRNAQVSMSQDKRWRNPRYWAAFTIQGEWK